MKKSDRAQMIVRMAPALYDRLAAAAADLDVSRNWLVNRALGDYLDRLAPGPLVLTRTDERVTP